MYRCIDTKTLFDSDTHAIVLAFMSAQKLVGVTVQMQLSI